MSGALKLLAITPLPRHIDSTLSLALPRWGGGLGEFQPGIADVTKSLSYVLRQAPAEQPHEPGFPICLPQMAHLYTRKPPTAQKLRSSHNRSAPEAVT